MAQDEWSPVHLIMLDPDLKKFKVNPAGIELIKRINRENPTAGIGIVSINGEQRTGKSYLLNQLLSLLP